MDFQDCIRFANENKVCYMATLEGNEPRVRPVTLLFADETGFYFQTGAYKAFYNQLVNNNKVQVCFPNRWATQDIEGDVKTDPMKSLRVTGEIEFIDDRELKAQCFKERNELMQRVGIKGPEDPKLVLFRIYKGEAFYFIRENAGKEADVERVKF